MSVIIDVKNAVKMYKGERRAVNGVSLQVREGESIVISGAAGSGKSTLMRLIASMEKPSAGEITVCGEAVHTMNAEKGADFRNRNIGIMQKNPAFMEELSVLENVAMPLAVRGVPVIKRNQTAMAGLKEAGISYIAYAYPGRLSIFEAQMASLARALIGQPRILLFDEITAGLSEKEAEKMNGIINAVCQPVKYTIIHFTTENRVLPMRSIRLERGIIREENQ